MPGLRERQGDLILYATSSDGLNWEKPGLGLHEFDGSRANNILLFDKHSPTAIVDEAADPSERYKMAAWDCSREQFGYWVAHSADGPAFAIAFSPRYFPTIQFPCSDGGERVGNRGTVTS